LHAYNYSVLWMLSINVLLFILGHKYFQYLDFHSTCV
jgi:hypothetical protein